MFPPSSTLCHGCTLAVLVNALATIDSGSFSHLSWADDTFIDDGTDGTYAIVTFRSGHLVATLFDHESNRNPFAADAHTPFDVSSFFRGMPPEHWPLAKRCMGYIRSGEERDGVDLPYITAAFWDAGEYLAAAEPWDQVWKHGGWKLELQLKDNPHEALAGWQNDFNLPDDLLMLAGTVFQRKMACNTPVELTLEEVRQLVRAADDSPNQYEEGTKEWFQKRLHEMGKKVSHQIYGDSFELGVKSLASIGIVLPPGLLPS